jgi:uncharacterized membrane protein
MKRAFWAAALGAALCLALAAPVAAANPARPFAGHDRVADTMLPPSDCPGGATWRYSAAGTGVFLHLGQSSVSVTHCTFVDMASGTGNFGPGTITITAANGDDLRLVHQGTFRLAMTPDGLTSVFDMTWVVAGGTGRFAGATGSGTTHGSSLLSTGITAASYQGEIAY